MLCYTGGNHVFSIIKFFLGLQTSCLGTHSEKAGRWTGAFAWEAMQRRIKRQLQYRLLGQFLCQSINNDKPMQLAIVMEPKEWNLHSTLPFSGVCDLII